MTKRERTPVVDYPPGHFTAPVYAWWPDWKPLTATEPEWIAKKRAGGVAGAAVQKQKAGGWFQQAMEDRAAREARAAKAKA